MGDDEIAVLARKPHRLAAGGIDAADDLLVDGAGEHHLDHFDGGCIGDAQPVHEARCDVELLEHGADLRAAAMDDHGVDARLLHQHDVLGEMFADAAFHGVAAIFHDDDLVVVFQDVGEGLHQHARGRTPARHHPQVAVLDGVVLHRHEGEGLRKARAL